MGCHRSNLSAHCHPSRGHYQKYNADVDRWVELAQGSDPRDRVYPRIRTGNDALMLHTATVRGFVVRSSGSSLYHLPQLRCGQARWWRQSVKAVAVKARFWKPLVGVVSYKIGRATRSAAGHSSSDIAALLWASDYATCARRRVRRW